MSQDFMFENGSVVALRVGKCKTRDTHFQSIFKPTSLFTIHISPSVSSVSSVCKSNCLSVRPPSICQLVCWCLSVCRSVSLGYLSVHLSVYPSAHQSVSVCSSGCAPPVRLHSLLGCLCLLVHPFVCLLLQSGRSQAGHCLLVQSCSKKDPQTTVA